MGLLLWGDTPLSHLLQECLRWDVFLFGNTLAYFTTKQVPHVMDLVLKVGTVYVDSQDLEEAAS